MNDGVQEDSGTETDVVVIGAGLAGLACSLALADAGLRVAVFEASDVAGGRARSMTDAASGDIVDLGPHILMSEYRNMLQLLDRLGTRDQVRWHTEKFVSLVDDFGWHDMYARRLPAPFHFLPSMLRIPSLKRSDLLSNRRVLWLAMHLGRRETLQLDRVDALDLLQRLGVTPRFIDWYWRTVSMVVMNVPLEKCSAGALLRFFAQMIGHSGYRIGFSRTGLGALAAEPAVDAVRAVGGRVRFGVPVRGIRNGPHGVAGVALDDGTVVKAKACVAAVPPQALEPLLPDAWKNAFSLFRKLDRFRPVPYVSTYLWFSRKLTAERFWSRIWSPDNFIYDSYDLSNIRDDLSGRGSVIASNAIGDDGAGRDDDELTAMALRDLRDIFPDIARYPPVHAHVNRVPMAIPAPLPGSEQLRPQTRTPVRGLFLAGDWVGTGLPASMESAVCAGHRAAERTAQHLGRRLRVALPLPPMQGIAGMVNRLARDDT